MHNVRLTYGLYRTDDNTPIKLKGSKLQMARTYSQETMYIINSITDTAMYEIQYARYMLLKSIYSSKFIESEDGIYVDLKLNDRHMELLIKEVNEGCFSSKNDDDAHYYGAWGMFKNSI